MEVEDKTKMKRKLFNCFVYSDKEGSPQRQ